MKKKNVRNSRGSKRPARRTAERTAVQRAINRSAKFYQLGPRRLNKINITWPKALVSIGVCPRVDYVNDKFDGKLRHYFHNFKRPPKIFLAEKPQKDGSEMIVIVGKFKIKPEGITG